MSNELSCPQIDDTLRLYALYCRGGFDFTLLFEEAILTIIPLAFLLVIAPFRIVYSFRKKRKVVRTPLLPLKMTTYVAFAAIELALLVLWALPASTQTRVSIPTQALAVVGSFALCLLSYAEHTRWVRPSFVMILYLFFTLLFDAARARTLWLRQQDDFNKIIAIAFTISVGLKFGALILEAVEKRRFLRPEYKTYPPEAIGGIFNRSFFWWLNPLFRQGFSKLLAVEDLYVLDKHLSSERYHDRMDAEWNKVTSKSGNALFFVAPLLINRAVILSGEDVTDWTTNVGYGLIGAYILVYVGIAVTMGQYQHLTYRVITMVRGGLISMLYRKMTDLSVRDVDPAASLTLMSADIERIVQGWQNIHEIWASALEIGVAIYLLQIQLGVSCAVPIGIAIASLIASIIAMSFVVSRQGQWLEAIERRISATTSVLGAMKGIKMSGLKHVILTTLHKLRIDELNISKGFRRLLIWNMALAYTTQIFAPVITFAVFSTISRNKGGDVVLDTVRVYTSLSLFALMAEPIGALVMSLSMFVGSIGCFVRIQEFLNKDIRLDCRERPRQFSDSDNTSTDSNKLTVSEKSGIVTKEKEFDLTQSLENLYRSPSSDAITVQRASFGWDPTKEPILKSMTFSVPQNKLTMLVGPVGCGKSTLLKAVLGEVPRMAGSVRVSSPSLAFCDQTPWHMNETVQKSIVAMSEIDENWYSLVIHACALEKDLHHLPLGDQTIIGSKGVALSAGQNQRVALARAIYARKEIVILDDSLSAVDTATENHIFHSLMGKDGLLHRLQSTIFIASSSAKRLPYADHIIVLDTEGSIAEQGHFDVLNATGGYVSSFNLGPPDWDYQKEEWQSSSMKEFHPSSHPIQTAQEIEAEANKRTGDISIYMYYMRAVGWIAILIFVVSITAFIFCISFPSIWVMWWAASNVLEPYKHLNYYVGIYVMLGILALIFLIVSCWQIIITMVPKSGEKFHWTLLNTVLSAPTSFFSTSDTGITLNRFSQDLQVIDMELPVAALNTFATFVLCIAQMTLIGVTAVYTVISFPFVLAVLYLIQKFYLRTSRQLRFLDLEAKAPLYSQFTECLSGLVTIRAFGWQKDMEEKNRQQLDRSQRPFYLLFAVQRWLTLVLDLVVAAIATILICLLVRLRGTVSAGYVGVALLNIILFSQSVKMLVTFWTMLETHIGAIARIKVFNETMESEDLPTENDPLPPSWPSKGAIEFQSVSAAYRPSELVLRDISLSIKAGEKIGICGRTGSGKSSLVLSIFRMIELCSGTITIDGVDISKIPRQEIRSGIIGVSQDPFLIKGSVRLNADPTTSCSDEAIIKALKSVKLMPIIEGKGGLDTDIDELFLSHGQKQLFCLARAMLRRSAILILDEPTSNVDSKTDEIMQRVIRENFSCHTILAVAHKLDTILDFDKVAMLDAGKLIEFDDPYTLLSTDSAFSKLYTCSTAEEPEELGPIKEEPIDISPSLVSESSS